MLHKCLFKIFVSKYVGFPSYISQCVWWIADMYLKMLQMQETFMQQHLSKYHQVCGIYLILIPNIRIQLQLVHCWCLAHVINNDHLLEVNDWQLFVYK